ncbi:MAG: diaminopimelate decarboxylase, partial [Burkholderiaceae bacterium]|nr:diaminopimelate decarboxylase [Burkholderiaceae bacterium]
MMHSIPSLIGFSQHHGEWFAEGISLSVLASQYGTPLYVYSKHAICSAYRAYDVACIRANGSRRARIHYAVKANSNLAVLDELKQLGAGFDLVSGGELARALHIGADPKSMVFAGVGKSADEIKFALT